MTSWPNIPKGLRKGMKVAPRHRRVVWDGPARTYRCKARYSDQVRCEEPRGHPGPHFHSFYMRSWEA